MSELDVRSSFVSFVDHLPSDIIRKLWLIQSLDSSYHASKEQLDHLLQQLQSSTLPSDKRPYLVSTILSTTNQMHRARTESLLEAKDIASTIKLARLKLENEHQQLKHDQSMHQNETSVRESLTKNSQRTNRRTNNAGTVPKLKLRVAAQKPPSGKHSIQKENGNGKRLKLQITANGRGRGRGRKRKVVSSTHVSKATTQQEQDENDYDAEDTTLYCICRKPSYGAMVACDNPKCRREWFHYACVGLTRAPRGNWLCPSCSKRQKR